MKPKRMRALACAALVLCLALLLGGCSNMMQSMLGGGGGGNASSTEAPAASAPPPSSSQAQASSAPPNPAARTPKAKDIPVPSVSLPAPSSANGGKTSLADYGTFVQATNTSPEYYPSLVFGDGVFMMTVNLSEGMAHVWGSFTSLGDDSIYACSVVKRDFAGFVGDDVESFALERVNETTLKFVNVTSIGMTDDGATFAWDGEAPSGGVEIPDLLGQVTADGDGGLNLRKGPGTSYDSYGLIPKGSALEVLNMTKNYGDGEVWYQVRYAGMEGWVAAQYTIFVSQYT